MDKVRIAETILENTVNICMREFISDYINEIRTHTNDMDVAYARFDCCIDYIMESGFDMHGWGLWEIPIFYSHCFWNKTEKKAFDLAVWDIGEVIPRYIKDGNEHDASSIEEAIEKGKKLLETANKKN